MNVWHGIYIFRDVDRLLRIFNFFEGKRILFEAQLTRDTQLPVSGISLLLALGKSVCNSIIIDSIIIH